MCIKVKHGLALTLTCVCVHRCANPHDPNVSILKITGNTKNRHQRRFMVKAFQFMDQKTNKYLNEEVSQSIQEAIVALNDQSYAVDNGNM